jgi:hypothetical protein
MKKYLSVLMSALLGIFATACSSDDDITSAPDEQKNGNDSYICVRIHAADDASTRADATTDTPVFKYGTSAEQKINKVTFYFFDGEDLIAKSEVSGTELTGTATGTAGEVGGNIEYNAKAVFKVTASTYPTRIVTVINAPDDFVALSPLTTAMHPQTLSGINAWRTTPTSTDSFVMSTTSYITDNGKLMYFTELGNTSTDAAKYFFNTKAEADAAPAGNIVDIYVERLASKVTVNVDKTEMAKESKNDLTNNIYFIENSKVVGMGDDAVDVYARIDNWGLNATTTSSYVVKNGTKDVWENLKFKANSPENFRSYWSFATNYQKKDPNSNTYPLYYESQYDGKYLLNYISENDMDTKANALGDNDYCNENTNTVEYATPATSAVTNVLINATLTDKDGKLLNGDGNIIRYLGTYYTYKAYLNFVGSSTNLAAVKYNGKALSSEYLKIANLDTKDLTDLGITASEYGYTLNGRIAVQLSDNVDESNLTMTVDGQDKATTKDAVNKLLAEFNSKRKAIAYNEGRMYYTIPIRHLASSTSEEGYYGVVRNHWYDINIQSISKPGHGISIPEEPIIPNEEDKEYYIQASINVLSWRVLTQNVTL